jgi:homoserine dehydrogenase
VAADIADVMTGAQRPVFQLPAASLAVAPQIEGEQRQTRAYVRLLVRDVPGVIAAVSETLAEENVSIDSFLQKPVHDAGGVPIVLTTHATPEPVLLRAIARIGALPQVLEPPRMIRIARV